MKKEKYWKKVSTKKRYDDKWQGKIKIIIEKEQ